MGLGYRGSESRCVQSRADCELGYEGEKITGRFRPVLLFAQIGRSAEIAQLAFLKRDVHAAPDLFMTVTVNCHGDYAAFLE